MFDRPTAGKYASLTVNYWWNQLSATLLYTFYDIIRFCPINHRYNSWPLKNVIFEDTTFNLKPTIKKPEKKKSAMSAKGKKQRQIEK